MSIFIRQSELSFGIKDEVTNSSLGGLECERMPIGYEPIYRDYLNAYFMGNGNRKRIRFLEIVLGSRVIGIARVVDASLDDTGLWNAPRGLEINNLIFAPQIAQSDRAKLIAKCAEFLLAKESVLSTNASVAVSQSLSDASLLALVERPDFIATAVHAELRIDLGKGEDVLFASLRKKHRQQINRYGALTHISVRTDVEAVHELHQLHLKVAGRTTRPLSTWKIQEQAIQQGLAFVITTRSLANELLGALFVLHSNEEAISFSAAYDRSAMARGYPLGHLCEWEAIRFLSSNTSTKSYLLGVVNQEFNQDAKLRNIRMFKDGFSPAYGLIGRLEYVATP